MKLFFGKAVFLVAISMSTLFGMEKKEEKIVCDTKGNEINWKQYKALYFNQDHGYPEGTVLGTQERWKGFKKGIKEGVIHVTPLMDQHTPPNQPIAKYFLAHSKLITLEDGMTVRFLYQSPGSLNGDVHSLGCDALVCIDVKGQAGLFFTGWFTNDNDDEKNVDILPADCHPPQEYFPDWKDNKELAVYY
jgi:hypothetical protein